MITFFVSGVPKSMAVGKTFAFKKHGQMHHVQSRTNTEWATMVGHIGREHAPASPLEGPVTFTAHFYMPVPQALVKKRNALPIVRPDVDNLMHKLTDQFNGVFWKDDSQVVDVVVTKRYAFERNPGVQIVVAALTAEAVQADLLDAFVNRQVEHAKAAGAMEPA